MSPERHGENEDQSPKFSRYPENHRGGQLLGITGNGHAAYLSDSEEIFFTTRDSTGCLQTPPPEFGRASEIDLSGFGLSIATFLKHSAAEHGKWQALSGFAADQINRSTVDLVVENKDTA